MPRQSSTLRLGLSLLAIAWGAGCATRPAVDRGDGNRSPIENGDEDAATDPDGDGPGSDRDSATDPGNPGDGDGDGDGDGTGMDAGRDAAGNTNGGDGGGEPATDAGSDAAPVDPCPGLTDCSGTCVNLTNNADHCGECGNECPATQVCSSSNCVAVDPCPGQTDCSGTCVNLTNNVNHCGSCGNKCAAGQMCSNSACFTPDPCPGQTQCNGTCVNLASNADHCGECNHECPANGTCSNSTCSAPAGCTFKRFGGHDYFFCSANETWLNARSECLDFGMDLAVPGSSAENTAIRSTSERWIGVNDRSNEGSFRTVPVGNETSVNGPAPSFTAWASRQPDNTRPCVFFICSGPGEDCAEMRTDGLWNDANCDDRQPFVCETF